MAEVHDSAALVISLAEATDRALVGGKAAELARLAAEGFPVPDGFVVTTEAYRRYAGNGGISAELKQAVAAALERVGGPLAYRSSGVAEDLADASFAGQYESVLNVEGLDKGLEAIQACWDSAAQEHIDAYRGEVADVDRADMAVLVQRMVDASSAGVAFGADPVTGAKRVVIEAVEGLGDKLLAGEVSPERWTVEGAGELQVERLETGPVIDASTASEIATLCGLIERLYGAPQDIEWAVADGAVQLLQCRPITALPVEPSERPPEGQTWILADGYFPEPILPLAFSTWLPRHSQSFVSVFEQTGMPADTIAHARYYGRVYDRFVPLGAPKVDRPPPPAWLLKLLLRVIPPMRKRLANARKALAEDLVMRWVDGWRSGGREVLRTRTRQLREVDLTELEDAGLADHLDASLEQVLAAGVAHFELTGAVFITSGYLGMVMEEKLGWEPARVTDLLQGYGQASVEDGEAIRALTAAIAADKEAMALLDKVDELRAHPGPGGQALRDFLDRYGHRAVGQTLSLPTWAEDPRPLISLVRHKMEHQEQGTDPRAAAAEAEAEARAAITEPSVWQTFATALERARKARPYGDESEADVFEATAVVRYIALEAGARLVKSGRLKAAVDVHYLECDELVSAIRGQEISADVERRKAEHRWALANPAPRVLGPEPVPPPPADIFPASVQPIVGAFLWAAALHDPPPAAQDDGSEGLRGLAASPGRATGTVRVIHSPREFDRIRAGDIVVCPMTMASWSPIFPVISGLITEQGGPLSHPATLAREYGLPAVLNVPGATSTLKDGQQVSIDGGSGRIELA